MGELQRATLFEPLIPSRISTAPCGLPLIATNGICFALSAFILAMKLLPRRQKEAVADALDPTT